MEKELIINVLSPYQHKAVHITKGWDFKVTGSPHIPQHGVSMKVYVDGTPVDVPFSIGVSSVIAALKGLKVTQFIVEYFHNGKLLCTLGCRKVRDVESLSKPPKQAIIF